LALLSTTGDGGAPWIFLIRAVNWGIE